MINREEWRDIPGYEGIYQVSSFGNVKSLGNDKTKKEKLLKPNIDRGYYKVGLFKNGKKKTFKIHQLVATCFHNHKPNGYEIVVNHIDNNQLNNHKDNLELVSPRYNCSCHKTDAGVSKTPNGKYKVQMEINNKYIYLGYFVNKEEGKRMYQLASNNTHLFNGNNKEFRDLLNNIQK